MSKRDFKIGIKRRDEFFDELEGIAEGIDHFPILPERPGPAVRKDQRLGMRPFAAHMDEVDRHTVDLGAGLRIRVDGAFLLAPVIAVDPVSHQLLEVGGVGAVLPAVIREVVGPARELEPRLQIVEHFIAYIDAKRFHVVLPLWSCERMRNHLASGDQSLRR